MTIVQPISAEKRADILIEARLRYTQILLLFNIAAEILGVVLVLNSTTDMTQNFIRAVLIGILPIIDLGMLWVLRQKKYMSIIASIVVTKIAVGALLTITTDYWWLAFTTSIAILSAATLVQYWLYIVVNLIILGEVAATILSPTLQTSAGATPNIVLFLSLLALSVTTRYFTNTSRRTADAARGSADLLHAAAETGQVLTKLLNLQEILNKSVDLIRERFDFYHVQVFLIDEKGEYARLAASTGAIGQQLFERQHKLGVGSKSVIGSVTSNGKMLIARDTDPIYYRNELLPNTRSELALPIFDGGQIIGALDVQSRREDAFTDEIIQALQVVTNLLATSIRNARLFEIQERNANEAKRLLLDSETNLREIQRLNQQLTRQGWQTYLRERKQVSGITAKANSPAIFESGWTESLIKATETRQPVRDAQDGNQVVAVPVMVGGEVIGAIEVETDDQVYESETVEMLRAVANRLATSLDKARLFEESQETTAREQRISEIVTRYQAVTNVDELLRITLEELGQTLGAEHGAIRLGVLPTASLNGDGPHD